MNNSGILLINKEKGFTSRDVVNIISSSLNTKKVGHTGTLDPNATGLLVVAVNQATKLVEILTSDTKEYIVEVILGITSKTLDPDSEIIYNEVPTISTKQLKETLNNFVKTYKQKVPDYAAVKVRGKKLYEYARANEEVEPVYRDITIHEIELLSDIKYLDGYPTFNFRTVVSKGTYIRSLVADIANNLNTCGLMNNLNRTKVGNFCISNAKKIADIKDGNYEFISILDSIQHLQHVVISDDLIKDVENGCIIDNGLNLDVAVLLTKENRLLAIYKRYDKDNKKMKPWKMF